MAPESLGLLVGLLVKASFKPSVEILVELIINPTYNCDRLKSSSIVPLWNIRSPRNA
ncbi:hypothetical protein Ptr902_00750 [Pyrenophora tritici-repentis]|uniref:Uncharacterized protein n=1 Tax=Pyrenophora tritici-repentis TaxID=45151 RepID=A0A5M9LW61_9PLEO|nr:hypothetical protein PtrV1_02149 [Pyrenophora tritici-repentis]KAF7454889.1 hypothetical protein A1F99_021470 [Pyrenophora tritici-repentis]KAF7578035.1 hypothetical protein PtrM4_022750 [Pyrenophora tritici-repentis]KAI0579199.1 hypothetical protein Alg215_05899 [Pyrenophora tritici-repentis]KAI0583876.1 hypothetical protein Alg130_05447 [Pyrenophora tritici-repentis]